MNARFAAAFLLFTCATLCFARSGTEVSSDAVDVRDCRDHMLFSFTGNVTATNDKFELTGDRLDVTSAREENFSLANGGADYLKEIHAFGNVRITQGCQCGTADEAIVDPIAGTVMLLGNATVIDSDGTAHGDKLLLNRGSNSLRVESASRSTVSLDNGKRKKKKPKRCNDQKNSMECGGDE